MPKSDWKRLLPEIKRLCENYLGSWHKSYKLSYEEAFSSDEVITLYFSPNRSSPLTLAELKRKLKLAGVRVVSTEQDSYRGVKYYALYIPKQYKRKVDDVLNDIPRAANVGYKVTW